MNSKQAKVLKAIFETPVKANIPWEDIEKLFLALQGEIINQGGSILTIQLNGWVKTFHRPHPQKEAKKWVVREVKKFLIKTGIKP